MYSYKITIQTLKQDKNMRMEFTLGLLILYILHGKK
jgi:hypothetical protein